MPENKIAPIDNAYTLSPEEVLIKLQSTKEGLSETEVQNRLKLYGENKLTAKKKISALSIFLSQFKNTLTIILIASAFLILFIYYFGEREQSDLIEAGLILTIILMIAILGFFQEYKAEKAVESLKKLLAFKAKVRRDGREKEIDVSQLVPGDIVILEEGQKIPADIRLLEVFDLHVNESSLTGESMPVTKTHLLIAGPKQISDQKNMVFSGTAISSGRAIGIVIKTGNSTEIGHIATLVSETTDDETPIQKRLDAIGRIIGYAVLAISAVVFIFIFFFAGDYAAQSPLQRVIHSFIAAVALAVAAIPEGLPAVVTISLALGTQRMLKKKALVRKLNSIETLGSTDVICSDKTGTLTKGEMTVKEIYFNSLNFNVSGTGYEQIGKFSQGEKAVDAKQLSPILLAGLLCNNASINTKGEVLGDPTEAALIVSATKAGLLNNLKRMHEIPFSSERRKMTVVVEENKNYQLYQKGAVEEVIKNCSKILIDGKEIALSESQKSILIKQAEQMSGRAMRVLAFAYLPKINFNLTSKSNNIEKDLIFLGFQGMIDPPRIEVKPLIDQCLESGIRVIMITGDHALTAKAVAHEIGIEGEALTGEEIDKLSDQEFNEHVTRINIYARVNPGTKMRIVEALKNQGHIVAMTGDGVNDAPALKKSDIGIAMGITGTDVAKESSDMVLMDDKFSTIIAAIEEGRGIFQNIRKFVNYLLACNIGEVMVVFVAVILFKELPLTATMLLWINVVTDGLPAVALGMDPTEKGIMKHSPKEFQGEIINKRLWLSMSVFGVLLTIGVLGIYAMNLHEGLDEAKGAAFTAIVIFELVKLFMIRANYKTSFMSNKWLLLAVGTSITLQLMIIYIPFLATIFNVKHIDIYDWGYMLVFSVILWFVFKFIEDIIYKNVKVEKTSIQPTQTVA